MFASDAREYIEADEKYHRWLHELTDVSKDDHMIKQLEKQTDFYWKELSEITKMYSKKLMKIWVSLKLKLHFSHKVRQEHQKDL